MRIIQLVMKNTVICIVYIVHWLCEGRLRPALVGCAYFFCFPLISIIVCSMYSIYIGNVQKRSVPEYSFATFRFHFQMISKHTYANFQKWFILWKPTSRPMTRLCKLINSRGTARQLFSHFFFIFLTFSGTDSLWFVLVWIT